MDDTFDRNVANTKEKTRSEGLGMAAGCLCDLSFEPLSWVSFGPAVLHKCTVVEYVRMTSRKPESHFICATPPPMASVLLPLCSLAGNAHIRVCITPNTTE